MDQSNLIVQTQIIDKHERPITCLYLISRKELQDPYDGYVLFSASEDGIVYQWLSQGEKPPKLFKTFKGHTDGITALIPADDILITTSRDRTSRIWDLNSAKCLFLLEGNSEILCCQVYNNVLFTGSKDRTVRVWTDINTKPDCKAELRGHKGSINCMSIIPEKGYLITGSEDCTTRVWDIRSGDTIRLLQGHTRPIRCIYVTLDSIYIGSGDGAISVWNVTIQKSLKCIATLKGHEGPVNCLNMVTTRPKQVKYLLSGSFDKSVKFWNLLTGKYEHEFKGHQWTVLQIATYQGTVVTGAADGLIRIWKIKELKEEPMTIYCATFVPKTSPPVRSLFEQFLDLVGEKYRRETPDEARENCWKIVVKLGFEDVIELENSETAHCPLCDKVAISFVPTRPIFNTCHWVKILSQEHYYAPYQSWNLVACCKACANLPDVHNIIDILSIHPGRANVLQQLVLKLFIGFLPRELWPKPTASILVDFVKNFYHPRRSLYESVLILDSSTLTLLHNIYTKTE